MTSTIAAIYRYPVKGLSAEQLDRTTLAPGDCLPQDRRFAIALPSTRFDPGKPGMAGEDAFRDADARRSAGAAAHAGSTPRPAS